MNRPRPTYFRNSLDLRDKVQVKILRKRLNLSNDQFAEVFRKSGNSISAIAKEAAKQAAKEAAVSMPAKAVA
jgi:DNA-binding transcriptional regulator YiaG